MPLNARESSTALFVRGLTNLKSILKKAEAHATEKSIDPSELFNARLAGDMNDLATQVHWAAEGAKLAAARLIGAEIAPGASDAKTFTDLHARIDDAITYLESLSTKDLEAGMDKSIELKHRGGSKTFVGSAFLFEFAIPSFYFHMTTAYGILRAKEVELTKGDFLGRVMG
jgi:hypothetical protein